MVRWSVVRCPSPELFISLFKILSQSECCVRDGLENVAGFLLLKGLLYGHKVRSVGTRFECAAFSILIGIRVRVRSVLDTKCLFNLLWRV